MNPFDAPDLDATTAPYLRPEPPDAETVVVEDPVAARLADARIAEYVRQPFNLVLDPLMANAGLKLMAEEIQQRRAADLTPNEVHRLAVLRGFIRRNHPRWTDDISLLDKLLAAHGTAR